MKLVHQKSEVRSYFKKIKFSKTCIKFSKCLENVILQNFWASLYASAVRSCKHGSEHNLQSEHDSSASTQAQLEVANMVKKCAASFPESLKAPSEHAGARR